MLSAFSFNLHFFFRWYADPARLTKTLSGKLTDGDGEAILMQHLDKIAASKRPTTMPPPKAHASSNSNSLMIGNLRMLRPIPAVMAARSSVIKYENIWQQCHYKMHSAFEPLQTPIQTHPDPISICTCNQFHELMWTCASPMRISTKALRDQNVYKLTITNIIFPSPLTWSLLPGLASRASSHHSWAMELWKHLQTPMEATCKLIWFQTKWIQMNQKNNRPTKRWSILTSLQSGKMTNIVLGHRNWGSIFATDGPSRFYAAI